jgi:hypothetical protein
MLFTEENLKNFKIKDGNFRHIRTRQLYHYHYACSDCGYPFLLPYKNGKYCNRKCGRSGKNNGFYNKTHTEENIIQMNIKRTGKNSPVWKGGVTSRNLPLYDTYAHQLEPIEKCVRDPEDPSILNIFCTYSGCKKQYRPNRDEVKNRIKGIDGGTQGFYCSPKCKQECTIFNQSKYPKNNKPYPSRPHQYELKIRTYNKDMGVCQKCGIGVTPETSICHHEVPVAINGLISLDDDNCWTLCVSCHKHMHKLSRCTYNEIKKNICKEVPNDRCR